jgi:hypothetical protein
MASHLLLVLCCKVCNRISTRPGERAARRLSSIPFHGIFRCNRPELWALDKVLLRVVGSDGQRGADVGASFGDDSRIEGAGLSGLVWIGWNGNHAGGESQYAGKSSQLHLELCSRLLNFPWFVDGYCRSFTSGLGVICTQIRHLITPRTRNLSRHTFENRNTRLDILGRD